MFEGQGAYACRSLTLPLNPGATIIRAEENLDGIGEGEHKLETPSVSF